jgi:protein gp37
MGDVSNIQWTKSTWNPWQGCTKVSPGCAKCYMYREKKRYGQDPTVVVRSKTTFDAPLRWWRPRPIFVCSWSDFFHEAADPWRDDAWSIIRRCPFHTFQIPTKRPERVFRCLPEDWPLSNVWLGVSVEYQRWADTRIPLLKTVPSGVRFVSCEPLLGPLDLRAHLADGEIHWLILGGESGGTPARSLVERRDAKWVAKANAEEWVRSLRDQCEEAGVRFFLKQWGGPTPTSGGRLLDGREWNGMPVGIPCKPQPPSLNGGQHIER